MSRVAVSSPRAWLAARAVSSWTADGARVPSGIVLEESVVGAGATLSGHGRVVRAVIWPGAVAVAPISDAIVTTEGVVAVSSLS